MSDIDYAERLLLYRADRGWSQGEVSRRSGLSPATVSLIESGQQVHPRKVTLLKLALAFGVSLEEFLSGPPKAPGSSVPLAAQILHRELGHDYLTRSTSELVWQAEDMSPRQVKERLRELAEESRVLHEAVRKPTKHLPPEVMETPASLKAARDEIRAYSRGFVARAMMIVGAAAEKQEESALRDLADEARRLIEEDAKVAA